jgi:2-polyprenyl-3-methyl-5-hydroxy-6-metoxy-1,4-benzoquinol methylase
MKPWRMYMEEKNAIIIDFNRIANTTACEWEHNNHYHKFLLNFVPKNCIQALDIGCGKGDFTRLLAKRSQNVVGIDLAPEMLKKAKIESMDYGNIKYELGDILEKDLGINNYDCITSIATFHHLTMREILIKLKDCIKPNGVLIILDLYKEKTWSDKLLSIVAVPINIIMMIIKTGKSKKSKEEIKVWEEHAKHDNYMTIEEINNICEELLPGVRIRRHLFWRYSLVWNKK